MGDSFDMALEKLHSKAVKLAYEVGGSALVVHRSIKGSIHASATPIIRKAFRGLVSGEPGRELLRELFRSQEVVANVEWQEGEPHALLSESKARRQAWVRRSDTLKKLADGAAQQLERRPFLVYVTAGPESTLCHGSSEGQQLVDSDWWRTVVMPALAAPLAQVAAGPAAALERKRQRSAASSGTAGGESSRGQQQGAADGQQRSVPRRRVEPGRVAAAAVEATSSGAFDAGPPSPPEASGVLGPPQEPGDALQWVVSAGLVTPSAPEGSAEWYGQCLASNPALLRPTQLVSRVFALPNYDVMIERPAKRITSEPVQVTLSEDGTAAACSCEVFAAAEQAGGGGAGRCHHTLFTLKNQAALLRLPVYQPGEVVPLCSTVQLQAGAVDSARWFWVDGAFVRCHKGNPRCTRSGHVHQCSHAVAVRDLRGRAGLEPPLPIDDVDVNLGSEAEDLAGAEAADGGEPDEEGGAADAAPAADADLDELPPPALLAELRRRGSGSPAHPFAEGERAAMNALLRDGPPQELRPRVPQHLCRCGELYTAEHYVELNPECAVYLPPPQLRSSRRLFALDCPAANPDCRIDYEGTAAGLYRYSAQCVVGVRLLYAYLDQLVDRGRTVSAFVADCKRDYSTYADADYTGGPFMSENQFRAVLYSFLYRIRRGSEAAEPPYCFSCPLCKDKPRMLIGDATSCTIQSRYYSGEPITAVDGQLDAVPRGTQQARPQRCYCKSQGTARERKECMQLLAKLAAHLQPAASGSSVGSVRAGGRRVAGGGVSAGVGRASAASEWSANDAARLEQLAAAYGGASFVRHVSNLSGCAGVTKEEWRDLARMLACLASESPVLSYLPSRPAQALRGCLDAGAGAAISTAAWAALQSEAPVVAGAMRALGGGAGLPAPAAMGGLLGELCTCSAACVQGPGVPPQHGRGGAPSCVSDECLRTGICSGLPEVRGRPAYGADGAAGGAEDGGKGDCSHAFHGGGGKTGGVFTWFCEHGVCYGFYIIPKAEGRNEAFSFLTRFFAEPPRVVVYDFGCALQEYCLNRAPQFFRDTLFVVDKFHWEGHSSCARSYSPFLYTSLDRVNTSIAEQCNAALKMIKGSIIRMTQVSFMLVVRFYLDAWNRKKIQRLARLAEAAAAAGG